MSISKFLINKKVVKNEQQANYLMIGVIIACLLFLGFKHFRGNSANQAPELTPEEIQLLEAEFGGQLPPEFRQ